MAEAEAWVMIPKAKNKGTECVLDMRPLVLCKDCKAWKQYDDMNLGECELYPEYNKMGDWFCNFGERKEGR